MGLMSFISKQFIDVIQWTDPGTNVLAYRFPMQDQEIQNGAQLVVREAQQAVFFNEGKFGDKFGPGTYTLNTQTLPILTYLKNWDKAFESPFKSDVYFLSMREFTDMKWGTPQPITIRDKEFGALRIRAFGNYSFKIGDVEAFWTKLSGAGIGAGMAMGNMMMQSLGQGGGAAAPAEDPLAMLEKLGELQKKGVLTQAEFDAKKAELLAKIK